MRNETLFLVACSWFLVPAVPIEEGFINQQLATSNSNQF